MSLIPLKGFDMLVFLMNRNCPIDLKEAITSVVFASPRCGDIPELVDVRKHLTAKYGKEFISAAVELRPNCGVSRMVSLQYLPSTVDDLTLNMKIMNYLYFSNLST